MSKPFERLSHIPFVWRGRTYVGADCLGYASIVSQYANNRAFRLWEQSLQDYYERNPSPPQQDTEIADLTRSLLDKRDGKPQHGDLVLYRCQGHACLTTYLEQDGQSFLAAMFRGGSRVIPFGRISASQILGVFDVERILA